MRLGERCLRVRGRLAVALYYLPLDVAGHAVLRAFLLSEIVENIHVLLV